MPMKRIKIQWLLGIVGLSLAVLAGTLWFSAQRTESKLVAPGAGPGFLSLPEAAAKTALRLERVAQGFSSPVGIRFVPNVPNEAVVLEKGGTARRVRFVEGAITRPLEAPLFQVAVRTDSELGLLGIAFDPKFEENGHFYVNYSPKDGAMRTRIARFELAPKDWGKRPAKEVATILEVEQPFVNHNAGALAFGPDGYLYVGFGDGGARDDPHAHGQNKATLLGTIARIDVRGQTTYAIPPDNPFARDPASKGEIWAYGLRNPWQFSFTPDGRLIVADVGQDTTEEIDWVERGDNLGWNVREAGHCFRDENCKSSGFVDPIFEYGRALGKSVTGGEVYTGKRAPSLSGRYIFADYDSGNAWALVLPKSRGGAYATATVLGKWPYHISSFGRAADGELFVTAYDAGEILRWVER
jgi:glucose/arabinose dehydrogenase